MGEGQLWASIRLPAVALIMHDLYLYEFVRVIGQSEVAQH